MFGVLQAASCAGNYTTPCPSNAEGSPLPNPWVLEGALVSGPTLASDSAFVDQRIQPDVRVSIEYNAGFTGALLSGPRQADPRPGKAIQPTEYALPLQPQPAPLSMAQVSWRPWQRARQPASPTAPKGMGSYTAATQGALSEGSRTKLPPMCPAFRAFRSREMVHNVGIQIE